MTIKGKQYTFEQNLKPRFYEWRTFIEITREVKNLLFEIAASNKLENKTLVDENLKAIRNERVNLFAVRDLAAELSDDKIKKV